MGPTSTAFRKSETLAPCGILSTILRTLEPAALLEVQGLLEELRQVGKDRRFADHQGDAGGAGGLRQRALGLGAKRNHRQVLSGQILFELREGGTNILPRGVEIGQNEHGFGLLGALDEQGCVRNGLHPIIQILQGVDQLAPRQQFFIKHQRQRLCHAASLEKSPLKCKRIWGIWGLTVF